LAPLFGRTITLDHDKELRFEREAYINQIDDGSTRLARTERRQFPRWTVGNLPATLFLGREEKEVRIENLSLSGASIINAPTSLKVGDSVVLATCLGQHGPFVAQCKVIPSQDGRPSGEIGLRFESLQQEDTNTLFFFLVERWQQKEAA
jgi:hypothetical protein